MERLEVSDHVTYCFGGLTYSGVIVGRYDFAENLNLPTAYKVEFDEPILYSGGERTVYMMESALKKEGEKETLE